MEEVKAVIRLHAESGSQEIQLLGNAMGPTEWTSLRTTACRLLRARNQGEAARLLDSPFEIKNGTNGFEDEFCVLYLAASLEQYVQLAERARDPAFKLWCGLVAKTISEIGPYVRFVAAELEDKAELAAVESPSLRITSEVVERALKDAENLIQKGGATSGLDRVHTALHGFLAAACDDSKISYSKDAGLTILFKMLRENHPAFQVPSVQEDAVRQVLRSMAAVLDALNPLRNRASMAHANEDLLEEPEAMLVVNTVRTLLHYLDAKLS